MQQTLYSESHVESKRTLCVLVVNEPGVLARIAGLFSGRGYNIESLTVSETEHEAQLSRITIVTRATPSVIRHIMALLERLVPTRRVLDVTESLIIERELALIKVAQKGETRAEYRMEALRLAAAFNAKVVDATLSSFVFEISGTSDDVDRFIALLKEIGFIEAARTGVAAIARGEETIHDE